MTGTPLFFREAFSALQKPRPTRKPRAFLIHRHTSRGCQIPRDACTGATYTPQDCVLRLLSGPQKRGKSVCKVQPPNALLLRSGMR